MDQQMDIAPFEIGLAIAGGGVSGAASVGVLAALEEANIRVTHIAGTSSGGIVAALYAYGYKPAELQELIPQLTKKQLDFDRQGILLRLLRRRQYIDGMVKGQKLHGAFERFTRGARVEDCALPMAVVATDLKTGAPVVFTQSKTAVVLKDAKPELCTLEGATLADALHASCAIPVLFQPIRTQDRILVDGGVVMNCPVSLVKAMGAPFVLAVDTVTAFANEDVGELPSAMSIFAHVINLTLRNQMEMEHQFADFVFHPHVGYVGALDFHKLDQCVEAGYRFTQEHLHDLMSAMRARHNK